jgi:hypothetical protein
MRVTGQPPGRCHLAEEPAAVTFGKQHAVVNLHGHFPADRYLPAPVHGGEAACAEYAADHMAGNVRCGDHGPLA